MRDGVFPEADADERPRPEPRFRINDFRSARTGILIALECAVDGAPASAIRAFCSEHRMEAEAMKDIRLAVRQLLKNRASSAIVVLTLALGIGANSALFGIVYDVLLKPLPYPEPERLLHVQSTISRPGERPEVLPYWSYPRFELLRDQNRIFERVAALDELTVTVAEADGAERVEAELVSASYFPLLGLGAARGRAFGPDEDRKGASERVVVIGDTYWRRRFGGDPGAVGRTLRANDVSLTVIGVMPPGFEGQSAVAEMWIPITLAPVLTGNPMRLERAQTMWHQVLARLRPGLTLSSARASLEPLERQLESVLPVSSAKERHGIAVVPFREATTDPLLRRSLWVLTAAVGFVLLVACVNVANLQLARSASRRRELAVRMALGATRGRIARQLAAENLVLGLVAGVVALVFARWAVAAMAALQPAHRATLLTEYAHLPTFDAIRLSAPVLVFNFAVALGCGLLFGLLPAWRSSRGTLGPVLHSSGDRLAGGGPAAGRARSLLVVAETALAVVLLAGAGLMVHSLARLTTTRLGFDAGRLLTFRLDQPRGASDAQAQLFFQEVLQRASTLPGVESACLSNATPLSGSFDRSFMNLRAPGAGGQRTEAFVGVHLASPECLAALRVPLLRGRWLAPDDRRGTAPVLVVNDAAARRYWAGADPVGQYVDLSPALGPDFPSVQVVGVIGDVKYDEMASEVGPDIYLSFRQTGYPGYHLTLRTAGDPLALAGPVRRVVAGLDRGVPVYDLRTMEKRMADSTSGSRFNTVLFLAFSSLAVVLAAIGIYGVVACTVAQRTREIGIRLALGAGAPQVLRLVVGQAMRPVLAGTLLGIAGALALARVLRSLLFGVSPADPLTFTAIPVLLAAVALLACWLPARRASRVDPMAVLRCE